MEFKRLLKDLHRDLQGLYELTLRAQGLGV